MAAELHQKHQQLSVKTYVVELVLTCEEKVLKFDGPINLLTNL